MNLFLKRARLKAELTQEELASAIGTSLTSVWRWEQGTRPLPFHQTALCTFFNLSPAELGWPPETKTRGRKSNQGSVHRSSLPSLVDPFLPPLRAPLLGRENVLADWQQHLCLPDSPHLFALTGLPGSGKTAVMQQLAISFEVQKAFEGVFWAQVGQEAHPQRHLQRWISLLGFKTLPTDLTEAQDLLRATIGQRRMLFVLDDVWTREDVAPYLLAGGNNCSSILTTRQPGLAHLLCQKVLPLPDLAENDAFELLVANLPPALVRQHTQALQKLVQGIGRLPGVLVQMREMLHREALMQPPRRFGEAIALLASVELPQESPAWPQLASVRRSCTLFPAIEQSEARLCPSMRSAFRVLAQRFLCAPFTEQDAIAVLQHQQVPQKLDRLMDAGLLEWSEQSYHFHPLFIEYISLASTSG